MADNLTITQGTGTTVATDEISSVHFQRVKLTLGAADTATYASSGAGTTDAGTQRVVLATDNAALTSLGYQVTATATITRPADTTSYTAGDAISDSTSTPTTGGFTLTGIGRISGGSGVITDLIVISNDTATLAGEVWIYDTSVTAINDNAAFSVSDADQAKLVAKVPFSLIAETNNAVAHIQNLSVGYTCVGSANLRFLLKATGGTLTTVSGNVYTIRVKAIGNN